MPCVKRVCLLIGGLLWAAATAALAADTTLVFHTTTPTNNLQGSLAAEVLFAQSQVVPARRRAEDHQPHLIGHRTCLVMVRLLEADNATPMQVAAVDAAGKRLGILDLAPPDKLPKTAYFLDGLPQDPIDFRPPRGAATVIRGTDALQQLSTPAATFLREQLQTHALIDIQTADGQWVRDLHFPEAAGLDGKMIRVSSHAGYASTIHYSGRTAAVDRGQTLQFKAVGGQWLLESELENQRLGYAAATWSGVLPADWIVPGITLWFRQGDLRGKLVDLEIGAPSELLLHTIDLGMLVPPRGQFAFANGLGHYEGGFLGSVHRTADQLNSTWGWDADKNRFLPNFSPIRSGKDTCLSEQCQSPFHGRSFGLDAMAGGAPFSDFNRFTLYTPYSAARIQAFFESKAVFDPQSPTGFRKWNADTATMEPYRHVVDLSEEIDAPVDDLSSAAMEALLAQYDLVRVTMRDGRWSKLVELPAASPANRGRTVILDQAASYDSFLAVNGTQLTMSRGFQGSFTSDGRRWQEGRAENRQIDRTPQGFGIPVTTLVGYYDPRGELISYIYPSLHGAYGFTYADDRDRVTDQDCFLEVETREGTLRFRLANHRIKPDVMNKFHVNIPQSTQPSSVAVVCRGKVVDKKAIVAATEPLTSTVHGE